MIERINALYSRGIVPQKAYRVEIGGDRFYRSESGELYRSLTTTLDRCMPSNRILNGWREKMAAELGSPEKAAQYVQNTADYGTALHIAVAEFFTHRGVNWNEFDMWAESYFRQMQMQPDTIASACDELRKDFASLLQFFFDYKVQPVAVELPVFSPLGYATLIDLVCEMDAKKYEKTPAEKRERVTAVINFKSGKKGFFDAHALQLVGELRAYGETYGMQAQRIINLAPSDWRGTEPTYKVKDWTKEAYDRNLYALFDTYLNGAKIRGELEAPKKTFTIFTGETKFGESPANNILVQSFEQRTNDFLTKFFE